MSFYEGAPIVFGCYAGQILNCCYWWKVWWYGKGSLFFCVEEKRNNFRLKGYWHYVFKKAIPCCPFICMYFLLLFFPSRVYVSWTQLTAAAAQQRDAQRHDSPNLEQAVYKGLLSSVVSCGNNTTQCLIFYYLASQSPPAPLVDFIFLQLVICMEQPGVQAGLVWSQSCISSLSSSGCLAEQSKAAVGSGCPQKMCCC